MIRPPLSECLALLCIALLCSVLLCCNLCCSALLFGTRLRCSSPSPQPSTLNPHHRLRARKDSPSLHVPLQDEPRGGTVRTRDRADKPQRDLPHRRRHGRSRVPAIQDTGARVLHDSLWNLWRRDGGTVQLFRRRQLRLQGRPALPAPVEGRRGATAHYEGAPAPAGTARPRGRRQTRRAATAEDAGGGNEAGRGEHGLGRQGCREGGRDRGRKVSPRILYGSLSFLHLSILTLCPHLAQRGRRSREEARGASCKVPVAQADRQGNRTGLLLRTLLPWSCAGGVL